MKLIKSKSTNNSSRHKIRINKKDLSKTNKLIKKLVVGKNKNGGRSTSTGRITVRHKGGGAKRNFNILSFDNNPFIGIVITVEYDSIRSAFVSLIYDIINKEFRKILNTNSIYPGSLISSGFNNLNLGCRMLIKDIPIGSLIHSISDSKNCAAYIRSAGTYGQLIQKENNIFKIRMPSGKILNFDSNTCCTIGIVSNTQHNLEIIGKAGTNRLKGIRPTTRGIAMNPVDHPHGGRTNGGRPSVTPWGIPTKGKPTVKNKKNG